MYMYIHLDTFTYISIYVVILYVILYIKNNQHFYKNFRFIYIDIRIIYMKYVCIYTYIGRPKLFLFLIGLG